MYPRSPRLPMDQGVAMTMTKSWSSQKGSRTPSTHATGLFAHGPSILRFFRSSSSHKAGPAPRIRWPTSPLAKNSTSAPWPRTSRSQCICLVLVLDVFLSDHYRKRWDGTRHTSSRRSATCSSCSARHSCTALEDRWYVDILWGCSPAPPWASTAPV